MKIISTVTLSNTLSLTETAAQGFWLYDQTREMNLSMRAKTAQDAFIEALGYYQRRLMQVESAHRELTAKVDAFVAQFTENEEE